MTRREAGPIGLAGRAPSLLDADRAAVVAALVNGLGPLKPASELTRATRLPRAVVEGALAELAHEARLARTLAGVNGRLTVRSASSR